MYFFSYFYIYHVRMQDKLDDVLPLVPMSSGMEQLLDEVMENMDQDEPATKSAPPAKSSSVAKHTPPAMSDPAANSSTVARSHLVVKPASLVTKPASLTTSTGTLKWTRRGHRELSMTKMLG